MIARNLGCCADADASKFRSAEGYSNTGANPKTHLDPKPHLERYCTRAHTFYAHTCLDEMYACTPIFITLLLSGVSCSPVVFQPLTATLPTSRLSSPWVCPGGINFTSHPWCNPTLPLDTRVTSLVSVLSIPDLVSAMNAQPWPTGGSGVNGIPPTSWWQEATHGAATRAKAQATFFPMPSHTVQAFNATLQRAIGLVVGVEGRALGNVYAPDAGWGFWAPNVNPCRTPTWARCQEVPGEDVTLSAAWAASYVKALQEGDGTDPRYLQVAATAKHLAGYDYDGGRFSGQTVSRSDFDARISLQDLLDSFLPPFQSAVEAGVAGVMAAYTSINGTPSAANPHLLKDTLGEWGFNGGYITGDCGAVEQVNTCKGCHNYTSTNSSTVAAVLNGGLTMDCGNGVTQWGAQAMADGSVSVGTVREAVARNLKVRFRLGAFDDPALQPMAGWGMERVCTPPSQALSLEAAEGGMVLLKNMAQAGFPLNPASLHRLALVGGNANDSMVQLCSYYAEPCGGFEAMVTPLAALTAALGGGGGVVVDYAIGCSTGCGETNPPIPAAVAAAGGADATLIVAGLNCQLAGEGNDRAQVTLPGQTDAMIARVCAAAAPRPCILALATGASLDISLPLANPNVTVILSSGYGGPYGGVALARAVLGLAPPPAGRLATTWYRAGIVDEVSPLEMGMRPGSSLFPPSFSNPGHTHRFYAGNNTLLPFGYGLSLTTWKYTTLYPPPMHVLHSNRGEGGKATTIVVNVTNTGGVDSDDVVLGFLVPPGAGVDGVPLQELFGWARVHVAAGCTQTVTIDAPWSAFSLVDKEGRRGSKAGVWKVRLGVEMDGGGQGMGLDTLLMRVV